MPSRSYRQAEIVELVGAVDDNAPGVGPVPIDEVWAIAAASVTNSGAATSLWIEMRQASAVGPAMMPAISSGSTPVALGRSFYLPPTFFLTARAANLAVGATLTLRFVRVRLRIGALLAGIGG